MCMRACVLIALVVCVASYQWQPTFKDAQDWFKSGGIDYTGKERLPEFRRKLIERTTKFASSFLDGKRKSSTASEFPYFGFIPPHRVSVIPNGPAQNWSATCFQQSSAVATQASPGADITITLTLAQPSSLLCSDMYLFGTVEGIHIGSYMFQGTETVTWTVANLTASEQWDVQTKGIRIFEFRDTLFDTIGDLLATVLLFEPELTKNVDGLGSAVNLDFMTKYRGVTMKPRSITTVSVDESLIQDGDFFGIIRLDGLDPMLAWAMGSTTGHTTTALRFDGQLYIVESTVNDSYWPTDGIQKTPYQQWLAQARAAGYNVVWLPLNKQYAAKFNSTAAVAKFNELEGFEYGYHNMLFGWFDTEKDNYPCLPPDYKYCLQWEHVEVIMGIADKLAPAIGDLMFDQAFNLRLGTHNLKAPDLFYVAAQRGLKVDTIPSIVEQDSFLYNTTRNGQPALGPSMVCCVFVCNMWKAGGLFDDIGNEVNCAELTNEDDYILAMFDTTSPRPPQCTQADPENPLCQLEGNYTLTLDRVNLIQPYIHMSEHCPTVDPTYKRPPGC